MRPRLFTSDEESVIGRRTYRGIPDLDHLLPDSVRISESCDRIGKMVGPTAEDQLGYPYEFYMEAFSIRGDDIIRDVYLPTQEGVGAAMFEPTPAMQLQCYDHLRGLRETTDQEWVTAGSIHGHGRITMPDNAPFSLQDCEHIFSFVQANSTSTRRPLPEPIPWSVMLNEIEIDTRAGDIIIRDGTAYHPEIVIAGLDPGRQEHILAEFGVGPGVDLTGVVARYLQETAAQSELQDRDGISARQWRMLSHSTFIIYRNDGRSYGLIGARLEDTLTHQVIPHLKQVPVVPVAVENDRPYDEGAIRECVWMQFEPIRLRQDASIRMTLGSDPLQNILDRMDAFRGQEFQLPPDIQVSKEDPRPLYPNEVATAFFHRALTYISLARHQAHIYSQWLSDVIGLYARNSDPPAAMALTYTMPGAMYPSEEPQPDDRLIFVNQGYGPLEARIVGGLVKGLDISPCPELEGDFMRDFAFAPTVHDQNVAIEKYVPMMMQSLPSRQQ